MNKTLTDLCGYLNNYFVKEKKDVSIVIEDGTFTADFLQDGQYFRILGSVFNDGIHKYPSTDLKDEEFNGAIWSMAVPQAVIDLSVEIAEWQDKYGSVNSAAMSPFASESFGNYSYSKGTAGSGNSGNPNTWQAAFSNRLSQWRKLRNI